MGAALAFYSAFSLAPLLIIVSGIAGVIFGVDRARAALVSQFSDLIGPAGADAVARLMQGATSLGSGVLATVVGLVLLFIGATSVLVELQTDLDRIWRAPPRKGSVYSSISRSRLAAMGVMLSFGFLLLVSLVAGTAVAALAHRARLSVSNASVLHAINFVFTVGMFTLLFASLFKWLPNVSLRWRDVWAGALTTSVLFNLGQLGIGLYLGQSSTVSAYAAAGSLLVLLLWLYYSAMIFLYGAEFTWVYGGRSTPAGGAGRDDGLKGKGQGRNKQP